MFNTTIFRVILPVVTLTLAGGQGTTAYGAAPSGRWAAYVSNALHLRIAVPADWTPVKVPNALAFKYDDQAGGAAGIGIMKSTGGATSIDEAADGEFDHEGKPVDWVRSPARVGGQRAIKIVGLAPKNQDLKIVHYYIEGPQGIYLVQCQAPKNQWQTYSPIFTTILTKLTLIQ